MMVWAIVIIAKVNDERKANGLIRRAQAWADRYESYMLAHEIFMGDKEFMELRKEINDVIFDHLESRPLMKSHRKGGGHG